MRAKKLLLFFSFLTTLNFHAQTSPGGVPGAEVWYIVNKTDVLNNIFQNSANTSITLEKCETLTNSLFNFNPSVTGKVCLKFRASLENSTGRDVFFVGQPTNTTSPFSHLATTWESSLSGIALTDSIIRNFVDLNNKNLANKYVYANYTSDKNARVNFYHFNNYNIDKKFKSYGQKGESVFYIGSDDNFDPDPDYDDNGYNGNFPEFISFPRELTTNERSRVESYLALKYGLTLKPQMSYRNSRNLVFWNKDNNDIFGNRIFGIGKDTNSGLNQLQSESSHLTKHLVTAVESIAANNTDKQSSVNIQNNNFIVFGDNNGPLSYTYLTNHGIRYGNKIWLAQVSGDNSPTFNMYFKYYLDTAAKSYLLANPTKTIWLIQDKYISNDEESEFDTESIVYYAPLSVNLTSGEALFGRVNFDTDLNGYDQFTFGLGAKIIIQAIQTSCQGNQVKLVITGGNAVYQLYITPQGGSTTQVNTSSTQYTLNVTPGATYQVTVISANNLTNSVTFHTQPLNMSVNLGPDQNLDDPDDEIVLSAGAAYPGVIYKWYKDGDLLPDSENTYTVTEPGTYMVKKVSDDGSCTGTDTIVIGHNFSADIIAHSACDEELNFIEVNITGGSAPYVTSITGTSGTLNHAHNGDTIINNLAFGTYTVTVTDSMGKTYTENVALQPGSFTPDVNLFDQLTAQCTVSGGCFYSNNGEWILNSNLGTFTLDASLNIGNDPNITYEWFANGIPLGVYGPVLTISGYVGDCLILLGGDIIEYSVVITNMESACSVSDSFYAKGYCRDEGASSSRPASEKEITPTGVTLNTSVYPNPSKQGAVFYYKATSQKSFEGTVELVSMSGAVIKTWKVTGEAEYTIPMSAISAGVYLVRITTQMGIKIDRLIIK